jgi:hypothetical protein
MKFRKKPVVIEATHVPDNLDQWNAPALVDWLMDHSGSCAWSVEREGVSITTLEGVMLASPGDWIIQGVKGELYPCKPDIFVATYEPAEASPHSTSAHTDV